MSLIGADISRAIELLRNNELVAIPTETVYGLAANGLNADTVLKIYEAKNRPSFNPLILHIANIEHAKKLVVDFPENARLLAEQFWPGPLTIVLSKSNLVPDIVTAGLDTVGIRVPNHALTLELLQSLDFPLAAPSANPSGYVSPTTAQHVAEQLGDKVAYILDGGKCTVGIESTIIKVTDDEVIVLRLGGIELEKIQDILSSTVTGVSGRLRLPNDDKIESPGMVPSHYAPRKKFVTGNIEENIKKFSGKKIGLLFFNDESRKRMLAHDRHKRTLSPDDFKELRERPLVIVKQMALSPNGDLHEAARNLFSYLRMLDGSDAEIILAEFVPDEGLGRAINDRLRRATVAR